MNTNRDFYRLLRDRVKVTVPDDNGIPETVELKVIDWDHPANNDFFLAQQLWVSGEMYRRRCDLVGFVNGIPLIFIELKAPHVPLKSAFDDNLRDYRGQSIPQLFHPNAFILLSNGKDTKIGTLTSEWEHFFEWKRIDDEGEPGDTRYVFTLIQKFRTEKGGAYPRLSDRRDIIVITDEAHRS